MLTVKLVYKLSNVADDLKWATNTYDTIYTHFQGITNNMVLEDLFSFAPYPSTHFSTHPYSFFTHPNDGWTGLYIKLCLYVYEVTQKMYDWQTCYPA